MLVSVYTKHCSDSLGVYLSQLPEPLQLEYSIMLAAFLGCETSLVIEKLFCPCLNPYPSPQKGFPRFSSLTGREQGMKCLLLVTHDLPAASGDLSSLQELPALFYSIMKLFTHLPQLSFDYFVLCATHVCCYTNVTEFYALLATLFSDVCYLHHLSSPSF